MSTTTRRGLALLVTGVAALSTLVPTAAADPDPEAAAVHVIQRLPNGQTSITIYTPAAGVSSQQLAADLRRTEPGEVRIGAGVGPNEELPCSFGDAKAVTCPPSTWENNGFPNPQVQFLDYTPNEWPVRAAVSVWDESLAIDSIYVSGVDGQCSPVRGMHCVRVYAGNYGATTWAGKTRLFVDQNHHLQEGGYVRFNTFHEYTPARRVKTVCHELGHVLGLDHSSSDTSCMVEGGGSTPPFPARPSSDDFTLLSLLHPYDS